MKTSNKILLVAGLLLVGSLIFYDWRLAAEYRKGDYTDRYYGYRKLTYSGFDEIELQSAGNVTVVVERGDYSVLELPLANQFLTVRQEGKRLVLSSDLSGRVPVIYDFPVVYISCPELSAFVEDARYVQGDQVGKAGFLRGFTGDSLTLCLNHGAEIHMEGNKLRKLSANLGGESDTLNGPALLISPNNNIQEAELDCEGQSKLSIEGKSIQKLIYHLADSASITLDGTASGHLKLH